MSPLPPVAIDAIEVCENPCQLDPRRKTMSSDNDKDHRDVRRGPSSTGHGLFQDYDMGYYHLRHET